MIITSIFKIFFSLFIQLYIAKVPIGSGSGESFPAPDTTKKVRIRNPDLSSLVPTSLLIMCYRYTYLLYCAILSCPFAVLESVLCLSSASAFVACPYYVHNLTSKKQ